MAIKGTIVDSTNLIPLKDVKIEGGGETSITDDKGNFSINPDQVDSLTISFNGYSPLIKTPYDGEGNIKEDLGIIKISRNEVNLSLEQTKSMQLDVNVIKNLTLQTTTSSASQIILNKYISVVKIILIPFILNLLSRLGISNGLEKISNPDTQINPQCPSQEELVNLINKRNKLVKQLNTLYKVIDTSLKTSNVILGFVTTLKVVFTTLKFIPIPTPPSGLPSLVPPIQDLKPVIEKNIEKFSKISAGIVILLTILKSSLQQALDLLALLDQQIQACSQGNSTTLESVNSELLSINKEPKTTPQVIEVNGFVFGVETESTSNDLKRKRAIAKNKQGIILLRGEYSYSASDQILIDELAFYIQTNDLKAD